MLCFYNNVSIYSNKKKKESITKMLLCYALSVKSLTINVDMLISECWSSSYSEIFYLYSFIQCIAASTLSFNWLGVGSWENKPNIVLPLPLIAAYSAPLK